MENEPDALEQEVPQGPIGYVPSRRRVPGNLFVPEGFPGYDRMLARRGLPGGEDESQFETRVCIDGTPRAGICVPLNWYLEAGLGWRSVSGAANISERTR